MPNLSAPFWRRLAARLIDFAVCLALTFLLALPATPLVLIAEAVIGSEHEDTLFDVAAWACYFTAYIGLEVFMLLRRDGQTIGKGLLGVRVIPADPWARPRLDLRPAAVRMLIIFLPFFCISVSGSNPESTALDIVAMTAFGTFLASCVLALVPANNRRTIHDLVTGTRVIRAPKRKVELKKDLMMALPGRIDFAKH
ncbi:RDD family protein [Nocardia sp. NPDC058705]|uniref:RDD family protein n=1 Tax=Nocardia sp. NPDC058705 TaxID=3346609 RepID=UPI0036CB8CF9